MAAAVETADVTEALEDSIGIAGHWLAEPYPNRQRVLMFAVPGVPQPQGSKSVRVLNGRAIVREAVRGLKPWRDTVTKAITAAMHSSAPPADGWPLLGPVRVEISFTMPKPQSAPKRRRTYPVVKPDVDKLARAALDALTFSGCIRDDSQVVDLHAVKLYPAEASRSLRVPGLVGVVYQVIA